jgi:hypothetical protein
VAVGRVDLGFFNRVIIDDVSMLDQKNDSMFYATRVSASIDFIPLFEGRISISSAQLFGLNAHLYKQTADSKPNFQFVLDSLASKDTTEHTPLDLRIGSLIIRHGKIKYDQRDVAPTHVFDTHHLVISDLSSHIVLEHLTDNSIALNVKKFSANGGKGLKVKKLQFKLNVDEHGAQLRDFYLELPGTELDIDGIYATYDRKNGSIDKRSICFNGRISQSKITPYDISCLATVFKNFKSPIYLESTFSGTGDAVHVQKLNLRSGNGTVNLQGKGRISNLARSPRFSAHIGNLNLSANGIKFITSNFGSRFNIPKEIERLGTINFKGNIAGEKRNITTDGVFSTDAGNANINLVKLGNHISTSISTNGLNLHRILDNPMFGLMIANLKINGNLQPRDIKLSSLIAKGEINRFDYNKYTYRNIHIDGSYLNQIANGLASIKDPNVDISVKGKYGIVGRQYNLLAEINHLSPSIILGIKTLHRDYALNHIKIRAKNQGKESYLYFSSPFAEINVDGQYNYSTLPQSIINLLASKIPSLPGLPAYKKTSENNFKIQANIHDCEWVREILHLPLSITQPITLNGFINDHNSQSNIELLMPDFTYDGTIYRQGRINISTPRDTLTAHLHIKTITENDNGPVYDVYANAASNKLRASLNYDNGEKKLPIRGSLDTETDFFKTLKKKDAAHINIHPSHIIIGDTIWNIEPSDIVYEKNRVLVDHFEIAHNQQHIIVSGLATPNSQDTLMVSLQDVNVKYILDLVNFHSVSFSGQASGQAYIANAFHKPSASAKLKVRDFKFQNGEMGTLFANATYDNQQKQINIDAIANDGPGVQTLINGYVAPAQDDIYLDIHALGTKVQFLESFCGSFMSDVDANAVGHAYLIGPLSKVNLKGDLTVNGKIHLKPTNVDYTLKNVKVHAVPDEIYLQNDTITDRYGNLGIINGGIHHKNLTKLSYDIAIKADHLLSYETHEFGTNTFYGIVFGTGKCDIHGNSDEVTLDINATPEKGTIFTYNAASPDAIGTQDFIHWRDIAKIEKEENDTIIKDSKTINIPTDLRMNFLIHANPNLTLRVMMDNETGDNITLNGSGVIRANYFNKGAFDMYGTYLVDRGLYTLTIQNVIKKEFKFQQGGTIVFGGDPYNALLRLPAMYTVNGVSLADLHLGNSFASNNIRVDCLMNITGTPGSPKITFGLDMPTVNADAKQMITSLLNSEEELNQQVLYLLAVGRFMTPGNNNASAESAEQQSQTSLAMQGLLSGAISQQLNTVLKNVVNNSNWNLGANISTGTEGFNNAEYEGLLNGSLLNNRLLFNGQFGYRDNANATTSFIGDFDLRYLINPNGNFAVRVYNQTNDRYFTRNSLNTQGLGFIIKRDFNGWKELFKSTGKRRKKKK